MIVEWTRRAAARGARVVVFPEMALTGYPVEDLALRASFVEASIATLRDVAERLGPRGSAGSRSSSATWTGGPPGAADRAARRGAARRGGGAARRAGGDHLGQAPPAELRRLRRVPLLRARQHAAGVPPAGRRGGEAVDVAVAICEDLWQDGGPVAVCRHAGAALLVVPNASPYERGKDDVRLELVQRRAREAGAALAYCNLVGGQDELVFDGDSILVSAAGELLARGPQFEEALIVAPTWSCRRPHRRRPGRAGPRRWTRATGP